jgi:hypothetical protein
MIRRRTRTTSEEGRERAPQFRGHSKLTVYVTGAQVASLVGEARRRADAKGAVRADVSEVLREVLDAWMKTAKR